MSEQLALGRCKGCDAVGLVELGEYPLCGRCLPNAQAIHLAEDAIKRIDATARRNTRDGKDG